MTKAQLTNFQHRQLLCLHFEGQFMYRNDKTGKKWPSPAWQKMINTLYDKGFIDCQANITVPGEEYLRQIELGERI